MTPDRQDDWHRLFGLTLTDVFSDTPWRVELEKDLAMQRQLLDVVIIERTAPGGAAADLPDGLDNLRAHNLLTYKSKQEPLDGWALHELIGHYVNYRKLLGPKRRLLPESDFQLYAVATRQPRELTRGRLLQPTDAPGVYDVAWGTATIRLIVLTRSHRIRGTRPGNCSAPGRSGFGTARRTTARAGPEPGSCCAVCISSTFWRIRTWPARLKI